MLRPYFILICTLAFAVSSFGQGPRRGMDLGNYGVRVEADKRLIVVLAALEMAEVTVPSGKTEKLLNTPLTEKGVSFREELRSDYAELPEDLKRKISTFVNQHKKLHPRYSDAEIVAPFISMAYALSPVPDLADPVVTSDLPGPLLDVLDFAPLVREFYRRSGIAAKLDGYARAYVSDADDRVRSSAREMVSELLDYLHTRPQLLVTERTKTEAKKGSRTLQKVETRELGRSFIVVPEKLAPKGNVTFLNIRDDYYVIVPPDTELNFTDARRAFLQFVFDPLVLARSREMDQIRAWVKPLIDERRKADPQISPDVYLAVSRSLVAAADIRQTEYAQTLAATQAARRKIDQIQAAANSSKTKVDQANIDAEKRAVSAELNRTNQILAEEAVLRLYEDYEKGAVLSFYFADQLKGIENSGFDIASSLREILTSFDPQKETERVAATAEARKRALAVRAARKSSSDKLAIAENPMTLKLLEIQKVIEAKNYAKAEGELKQLLAQGSLDPRVYYTIGRVASLDAATKSDPEEQAKRLLDAKVAFSNVLRTATADTDKALLSLTYVALARIYEHMDDNGYAIQLYDKAIELSEVTGGAYRDAIAGKQRLAKRQ
jgi:hypothetical protein